MNIQITTKIGKRLPNRKRGNYCGANLGPQKRSRLICML